jgi:hypothetical protein
MHKKYFGKTNSKNALCWEFYCVNNNKEMNVTTPQIMHCILCHNNPIFTTPKTQARKWIIISNTTNGIATLKKHINSDHSDIVKRFEEKFNCPLRQDGKKPSIKRPNIFLNAISNVFATNECF